MELSKDFTIKDAKAKLKEIQSSYSLGKKEKYIERFNKFRNIINFPWREDQKYILKIQK